MSDQEAEVRRLKKELARLAGIPAQIGDKKKPAVMAVGPLSSWIESVPSILNHRAKLAAFSAISQNAAVTSGILLSEVVYRPPGRPKQASREVIRSPAWQSLQGAEGPARWRGGAVHGVNVTQDVAMMDVCPPQIVHALPKGCEIVMFP